jgi:hypothetical protein
MASPPKEHSNYKGTVYGNVLDQFDNVAYNLKLYMIPPVADPPSGTPQSSNPRGNSGSSATSAGNPYFIGTQGGASGGGGYLNGCYRAANNQTVVLAQTGVTGVQIDNLEITAAVASGNNFEVSTVNFDIIQPGAANFIDQIMAAKAKIGAPVFANDIPLFLEVTFKGYTNDIEDNAAEGVPVTVAGPIVYSLIISTISLEIDEKGSVYNFSCVPQDRTAFQDQYYRLPAVLTANGDTITKYVKQLQTHLDDYRKLNNTEYSIQDEICFDLSGILDPSNGPGCFIKDETLSKNTDIKAEDINRIMNPELLDLSPDEYEDVLSEQTKDEGTLDIIVEEDRVTFREGVTIETFFATVLSMSTEFFHKLTRTENADDPEGPKPVDRSLSYVKWFKMNTHTEYIGYDAKRNRYAQRVTYKPTIFNSSGEQVQYSTKEQIGLSKSDVQSRFDGMAVFKSYHYLFTGRNDQIINCRVAYNAGHSLLLAPAGGVTGDFSTIHADTNATRAYEDDDLTGEEKREAAKKAADREQGEKAFDSLRDSGQVGQLAAALGMSAAEAQAAAQDSSSQSAKILKNILADKKLAEAARKAQEQVQKSTSSDNVRNTDNTGSGTIYSADIVDSVSERLDQAVTAEAAKARVNQLRALYAQNPDADPQDVADITDTQASGVQQMHITNPAEAATYDGTARNTIFGYVMQQHGSSDFLVTLDLEIKGDPWYLGPPSLSGRKETITSAASLPVESTPENMNFPKNENYVMFEMQTPRLFDHIVSDEDANDGYWGPATPGTAYFISGIYKIKVVKSSFSGGLFSQDLDLVKIVPIRLSQLEKQPPEFKS